MNLLLNAIFILTIKRLFGCSGTTLNFVSSKTDIRSKKTKKVGFTSRKKIDVVVDVKGKRRQRLSKKSIQTARFHSPEN
jgi:hypothetical protein